MAPNTVLEARWQELRRRVAVLPTEVDTWREDAKKVLDMQAHTSQLEAIRTITSALVNDQENALKALDPKGAVAAFESDNFALVKKIIKAQRIWNFFREKLDLRFSRFKEELWVADTIAWNCHRPVLDKAVEFQILSPELLREPPLIYLAAGFSPLTWCRGTRPNDGRTPFLDEFKLPIPVIELPWDHIQSAWELLAVHHEVGHDLEADLKIREELQASLRRTLASAAVPQSRVDIWAAWQAETLADLIALQLAGSAFADQLMHLLMLPPATVVAFDEEDPHPNHYVRVLMNADYIRTMAPEYQFLLDDANRIESIWKGLYGDQPDPALADFPKDFGLVFKSLMDTPLAALKNKSVRELMPFLPADDARIRAASSFVRTGMARPSLPPRHAASGARMALTQTASEGNLTPALLSEVQTRSMELVRKNAPPGLRGGGGKEHSVFLVKGFLEAFSDD
jgi:hypothetical protein